MIRRISIVSAILCLISFWIAYAAFAQEPGGQAKGKGKGGKQFAKATRDPLFFREEWKQTPQGGEHAVGPEEAVSNPSLELKLYGASAKDIQLTGAKDDENNPIHLWTGLTTSPTAATLRDKTSYADLTGLARIRWVTKMSGFHRVRPVIKLADGTLLVGDRADGSTADWLTSEIAVPDMHWRRLDPQRVVTVGDVVANPDLTKVDEIGFADLMPGSGHGQGGWADVGLIEVFAKRVSR